MRKGEGRQEGIQKEVNPNDVQTSIYHEDRNIVGQEKSQRRGGIIRMYVRGNRKASNVTGAE